MDATITMSFYDEALDEAMDKGESKDMAHQEAITAAAMMLAAMEGIEDGDARTQVEAVVSARAHLDS